MIVRWTKSLSLLAGLAVGLVFAAQSAQAAEAPDIHRYTLKNGLEVVVIPDHRTPVVVHSVWYKIGGADEPRGKSGIAHFLEHLMFRGTKKYPDGEFSRIIALNGGRENAATSQDYTFYYQMVAKDRLPLVMQMEADRMVNLQLTDEVVETERKVILEERSSRIDNQPGAKLSEQMEAMLYLHHPYGEPIIGWRDEIEQLDRSDAEAFYERFYTPTGAYLIVAGDVTGEEVLELARKHYGKLKRREVPPSVRVDEPAPVAPRSVTYAHPDVGQPVWRRTYVAPSAASEGSELSPALDVLSQYLGGGILSQLYQNLVVDQKIAAGAAAGYNSTRRDLGYFSVYAVPAAGESDLDMLEEAVEAEITRVANGDVDAEAVERAKTLLKADVLYARDNIMSMMQIYGSVLVAGLDVDYVSEWESMIDAVTPEDLTQAARAVLVPEASVTGRLLPAPGPEAALQGAE